MTPKEQLNRAFDLVVATTGLRPPQAEALAALRDVLLRLPKPLCECDPDTVRDFLSLPAGHPRYTFELATGLGKTRLAGAMIAMLWLARQADKFLILAPRRAVLRRLENALDPRFREYLFVNPSFIPEPRVIRSDEVERVGVADAGTALFEGGPQILLLSHQLVATSERFRSKGEFADLSPQEALRAARDLVVISDEAHHVGCIDGRAESRWRDAINDLSPKLEIGLTATPRSGDSGVLYRYPLPRALADGRYTKAVQLLVRTYRELSHVTAEQEAEPTLTDIDRSAIDFGLQRLKAKEQSIASCEGPTPFPRVKPVLVIFAANTTHAENVCRWLLSSERLSDEELLRTDSRTAKTEEAVERLLGIDAFDNPVKVVVNVQELVEGWDVSNVYVVLPLRAMATFAQAVQAMGRGLRLPAGRRTGNTEVDTLDVVLFGRDDAAKILAKETEWAGATGESGGSVVRVVPYDAADSKTAQLAVASTRPDLTTEYRVLQMQYKEPSLSVEPAALARLTRAIVHSRRLLEAGEAMGSVGATFVRLPRERFAKATANRVVRQLSHVLSDEQHLSAIQQIVERWLDSVGVGDPVPYDPAEAASELSRILLKDVEASRAAYIATGSTGSIKCDDYQMDVEIPADTDVDRLTLDDVREYSPAEGFARWLPYKGWRKGRYNVTSFDSNPEAKAAWLLDRDPAVSWWLRNQPRRLVVPTPIGNYHPDFVVCYDGEADQRRRVYLIEVKADEQWEPQEGDARRKAAACREWCRQQSVCQEQVTWDHVTCLESSVLSSNGWPELLARSMAVSSEY
jgi:superfamily II DNA or RNA helicase